MVWQESHWHRTHRLLSADLLGLRAGSRECAWFSHRPLIAHKSRGHLLLTTRHPAGSDPADRSPSAGNTPRLDSWLPRSLPSPGSFSPLPNGFAVVYYQYSLLHPCPPARCLFCLLSSSSNG